MFQMGVDVAPAFIFTKLMWLFETQYFPFTCAPDLRIDPDSFLFSAVSEVLLGEESSRS